MSYSVQRYHDISCGHRVHGHESKCAHLHGHNYRFHFTCIAEPVPGPGTQRSFIGKKENPPSELDSIGRVIDFSVIKALLCEWLERNWDHMFLIWQHDPQAKALAELDPKGVVLVPFNPTAENMAEYMVRVVGPAQLSGSGVMLLACRIDETRKCSATYSAGGEA